MIKGAGITDKKPLSCAENGTELHKILKLKSVMG